MQWVWFRTSELLYQRIYIGLKWWLGILGHETRLFRPIESKSPNNRHFLVHFQKLHSPNSLMFDHTPDLDSHFLRLALLTRASSYTSDRIAHTKPSQVSRIICNKMPDSWTRTTVKKSCTITLKSFIKRFNV